MPLPFPRHDWCGEGSESLMEGKDRKEDVCEVGGGERVGNGGGK